MKNRRWLHLLNPVELGLPGWVETIRPLSHLAPKCVTYCESDALADELGLADKEVVVLKSKSELFEILREGTFQGAEKSSEPLSVGRWCDLDVTPFKVVDLDIATARGAVWMSRGVEMGSCVTVQRGIFGEYTEIGSDVKIDSHAHVGHGVVLGDRVIVTAHVTLAGWVEVGHDAWIGIGSQIIPHVKIGHHALVGAGAVVIKDVPDYAVVVGNPAMVVRHQAQGGTK